LYTLDVKERSLPNSSFYAVINQLLYEGKMISWKMLLWIKQEKLFWMLCYLEHIT